MYTSGWIGAFGGEVGKGSLSGPTTCFIGLVDASLELIDPVTWSVISVDHQLTMTNGPLDLESFA